MNLTGNTFFVITIVLVVIAVLLPLLFWSRLRGPAVVRGAATGRETTPSVVYFENAQNVVVGEAAKNVSRLYPKRIVQLVKRSMGKEVQWEFDDQTYTPESISALILKQLAQDAREYSGRGRPRRRGGRRRTPVLSSRSWASGRW